METLLCGFAFATELRDLGINIPEDVTGIRIILEHSQPALLVFYKDTLNKRIQKIRGSFGVELSSEEFYNKLKEVIVLPEHTTKLVITANTNSVVGMEITAALPSQSLEFLRNIVYEKAEHAERVKATFARMFAVESE